MTLYERLARPSILKLKAYQSARSLAPGGQIFLDANELPEAPSLESGFGFERELNRYPLPQPQALLDAFAQIYGVHADKIIAGRGSDEAIDLLTRTFCEPEKDEILVTPPTYGMYEVSAAIQNVGVITIPLRPNGGNWQPDVAGILKYLRQSRLRTKIIFLCSPNNPTGTAIPEGELRKICAGATDSLVVVDEAYGDFSPLTSAIQLLDEFPQLVVLRTLSKAWGLAGLRCGVCIGHPDLIALLQNKAPYPLPRPVIDLALRALKPDRRPAMLETVREVIRERDRLRANLLELPIVTRIFPSHTNFLLVRFSDEQTVMKVTGEAGIILRSRNSELGLENCVRITVGTSKENETLMQNLRRIAQDGIVSLRGSRRNDHRGAS